MKEMDEESLELLRKRRYGWMSPKGEVTVCDPYGHLGLLREHLADFPSDFEAWIAAVESLSARGQQDNWEHTEHLGDDDHPCWHAFHSDAEDARDDLRQNLMVWLYRNGWLRLGTARKYLEAEGCPSVVKRNTAFLEDAALRLGMDFRGTPTSYRPRGSVVTISPQEMQAGLPEFHVMATKALLEEKGKGSEFQEKDITFKLGWDVYLDAFRPEMLAVRLPGLLTLSARATLPTRRKEFERYHDANSTPWKWQGPFPEALLEDIRHTYFAAPPDREALRDILRLAGADDIGPAAASLST